MPSTTTEPVRESRPDSASDERNIGHLGRAEALDTLNKFFDAEALTSAEHLAQWASAFALWLVDAVLVSDAAALRDADAAVKARYRQTVRAKSERSAGAVQALAEVTAAAAARLQQKAEIDALEPGSWAARMLVDIGENPGATNGDIGKRLGSSVSQISRSGRTLAERGLTMTTKIGREVHWSLTPRGEAAAKQIAQKPQTASKREIDISTPKMVVAAAAALSVENTAGRWYDGVFEVMGETAEGQTLPWFVIPPPTTEILAHPPVETPAKAQVKPPTGGKPKRTPRSVKKAAKEPPLFVVGTNEGAASYVIEAAFSNLGLVASEPGPNPTGDRPVRSIVMTAGTGKSTVVYDSLMALWAGLPDEPDQQFVDRVAAQAIDDDQGRWVEMGHVTAEDESVKDLTRRLAEKLHAALSVAKSK